MSHSLRRLVTVAGLATLTLVATVTPALASPSATTAVRASISSVTFSGQSGSGVASPTVTVRGSGFGTAPAGTSNAVTSCGTYSANGNVYGGSLYFTANQNFEAGYSDADGADCIGVIVVSWSTNRIVLKFGNSYGSFAHWYLDNGDGYALSLKTGLYGSKVRGLS